MRLKKQIMNKQTTLETEQQTKPKYETLEGCDEPETETFHPKIDPEEELKDSETIQESQETIPELTEPPQAKEDLIPQSHEIQEETKDLTPIQETIIKTTVVATTEDKKHVN